MFAGCETGRSVVKNTIWIARTLKQAVKARTFGRQNERNFCHDRLALTASYFSLWSIESSNLNTSVPNYLNGIRDNSPGERLMIYLADSGHGPCSTADDCKKRFCPVIAMWNIILKNTLYHISHVCCLLKE